MSQENKTWESVKQNYLEQVEAALKTANHSKTQEILEDVGSHLEQKFAELSPDAQTWENFQKIITDMGPASDYAELLAENGRSVSSSSTADRRFVFFGLGILAIIAVTAGAIWMVSDFHPFRITDKIDYPFVNDPQVLGKWVSVDFVQKPEDFTASEKHWSGDLYLKELRFFDGGTTGGPWRWTKGLVLHPGDKTAAAYTIKTINGDEYMFFEWKSGDYTIRHQTPKYYVLRRDNIYIISFKLTQPMIPLSSRQLLDTFNKYIPHNVHSHHYRTEVSNNELIGHICVDTEDGKDATVRALSNNGVITVLNAAKAGPDDFDKLCSMHQPSLGKSVSSNSTRPTEHVAPLSGQNLLIDLCRLSITTVSASSANGNRPLDNQYYGVLNLFDDGSNIINNINYTSWLTDGEHPHWVKLNFSVPVSVDSVLVETSNKNTPTDFAVQVSSSKGNEERIVKEFDSVPIKGMVTAYKLSEPVHNINQIKILFPGPQMIEVSELKVMGTVPPGTNVTPQKPAILQKPDEKGRHIIVIKRTTRTDIDSFMIKAAENAYPPRNNVLEAMIDKHKIDVKQPPEDEKLWWYDEFDNVRIPYAITGDAVNYYTSLVNEYRQRQWKSDITPSSHFEYSASVELKKNYENDRRQFLNVYVAQILI